MKDLNSLLNKRGTKVIKSTIDDALNRAGQ